MDLLLCILCAALVAALYTYRRRLERERDEDMARLLEQIEQQEERERR